MSRKYVISNSILWASAILASAIVDAPTVLTGVLLPLLALGALILNRPTSPPTQCRT